MNPVAKGQQKKHIGVRALQGGSEPSIINAVKRFGTAHCVRVDLTAQKLLIDIGKTDDMSRSGEQVT